MCIKRYYGLLCLSALMVAPVWAIEDEVPKGEVTKHTFADSKIFPGTTRDYWIYVPAQYDPAKPACVYVNQDGIQYNAPEVFDRLIAAGEMPVTIGVFVQPGRVPAIDPEKALDRFNRSFEYDGLGDNYARFLLEELLPDVESKTTGDGRAIRLSKEGNDRAIGGASSGAVCAWTAAWERPGEFSRVFSAIGTYVGLRGANDYPTWIRKYEPKPIRVFLEDGENDLNIYGGDWWMANQEMERALRFAGYEVEHSWGTGGHSTEHATQIFPDAMRYLWKGWPEPVGAGKGSAQLQEIVEVGNGWEEVVEAEDDIRGIFSTPEGSVVYRTQEVPALLNRPSGSPNRQGRIKLHRIAADGTPRGVVETIIAGQLAAFGPDGKAYSVKDREGLLVSDLDGSNEVAIEGRFAEPVLVLYDGTIIAKSPRQQFFESDRLVTMPPGKPPISVALPAGTSESIATLSPDRSLLYMAGGTALFGDSLTVSSSQYGPNGEVRHWQPFFRLEPLVEGKLTARTLAVDRDGRLYVATSQGVQICDQAGRVNVVLTLPFQPPAVRERDARRGIVLMAGAFSDGLAFGGPEHDVLYVSRGSTIWRRKLKVRGAPSFLPPVKPKAPRL